MQWIILITLFCDLAHHRSALPDDIAYRPYKHVRLVRSVFGIQRVRGPVAVHMHDRGTPENPELQNPHNTEMFRPPGGGLTKIKGLQVQKWIYLPGKPQRYVVTSNINGTHAKYRYPVGTRLAETIAYKGRVFEVRCSHKTESGWEFDQDVVGPTPPKYEVVTDCERCHQIAGMDSHRIPTIDGRSWWGYGFAPGQDMVISFDPNQDRR